MAGHRRDGYSAGWLWGAAIVFQPLVLVILPVALAMTPAGAGSAPASSAVLPTAALHGRPAPDPVGNDHPGAAPSGQRPDGNHPTPWIALSTRINANSVTTGPGRIIALVLAVGLGLVALRRRPSLAGLVWLAAVALTLRCLFEAVWIPSTSVRRSPSSSWLCRPPVTAAAGGDPVAFVVAA